MSLDRATVEAWVRGEPGTVQAEDIAEDWLRKEEALKHERAARSWAYEQLRQWWCGAPRDTSNPEAAIAELDRQEAALDAMLVPQPEEEKP